MDFRITRVSNAPTAGRRFRFIVWNGCENLDASVDKLKGEGIPFDAQPRDQPWLWREAYLHDPDGNVICLYHAGANRRNPPWRMP